jgi:DNA-directed RNA polymerase subunit RPC12/RpoP
VQVTVKCQGCGRPLPVDARDDPARIRCGRCGAETPIELSESVRADRAVDICPMCAGRDFYARKDFDPRTGLLIVMAGGVVSAAFYWFGQDLVAYGVLAAAVLIDVVAARWLGEVTVCYRCHAEFRGGYRRTAPAFDLHTADVLEHEYARRQRGSTGE